MPDYRGGAPLVWAIINGEDRLGSTLFRLAGGVDDGDIAHQVRIHLPRTGTIGDATRLIEDAWMRDFPDIWRRIVAGTATLTPQPKRETPQWPNRKPMDGAIDWSLPAARVHDFIRAQSAPYPGAFADFGTIERSTETWVSLDAPMGELTRIGPAHYVRCGDGAVLRIDLRQSGVISTSASPAQSFATASDK